MVALVRDPIGIPGVGTQESHTDAYGGKWQMGIAVDLLNRKFDFGTVIKYTLAADSFGSGSLAANAREMGITAINLDINSLPSNYIQHGDRARLGPSTILGNEGRAESIRIAAAAQNTPTNSISWTGGMLYSIDRLNKYQYSLSDPVTIYGTGMGFGWEAVNAEMATLGIFKGYSSLGQMGRYSPNKNPVDVNGREQVDVWENSVGDDFIGIKIMLPVHASYNTALATGPSMGPLSTDEGPSVFNSKLGLAPWRDPDTQSNPGTWDWAGSTAAETPNIEGVFRYVHEHSDGADAVAFARFAYNANTDPSAFDWGVLNAYAPVLTGFVHGGGQFKDTAQCLMVMSNSISDVSGAQAISNGIFTQFLYSGVGDRRDISYAKLVAGTYYRLGLTWKGTVRPDSAANIANTEVFAKFQWGGLTHADADVNHYQKSIITTDKLLSDAVRTQSTYKTNMTSGFVQTVDTDDLDTDYDNLRIDVVMRAFSDEVGFFNDRQRRGVEIQLFIDNIWLEHEGDIPGATNKGYIELDHYPESGTLLVNRFRLNKPVTVATSTSQETVDPSGGGQRYLHQIDGAFERVSQTVWQQIKALLRWQDLGYSLTLHPFLPEVPHCLVGRLEISGVSKSFWDLTRHSFKFRFTEIG